MKQRILALIMALTLLAGLAACKNGNGPSDPSATGTDAGIFTGNAVTAYTIDTLGNADDAVQMLVLLADGWVMDVSMGGYYNIAPGKIENMAYEAVSDDVFRWQPSEEALAQSEAENANLEMRIIYSDPDGRFIVYSPNVENPDLANIIINPDHFADVFDEKSKVTDLNYKYFYKIKDKGLKAFSKSMDAMPGFDDFANMKDD